MQRWMQCFLILASLGCLSGCGETPLGTNPFTQPPALEFPFSNPSQIQRLAAFNTPNWSGSQPHNGIDLVLEPAVGQAKLFSPAGGVIKKIDIHENSHSNPPGQLILSVGIFINFNWSVDLSFEPGTNDPAVKEAQTRAIAVSLGQQIKPGDPIGDLLKGERGYTHLHYMVFYRGQPVCAYDTSSDQAKATFEAIANRSHTKYRY